MRRTRLAQSPLLLELRLLEAVEDLPDAVEEVHEHLKKQ